MGADYFTTVEFLREGMAHEKRVAALRALEEAGVEKLPRELADYFNNEYVKDALHYGGVDAAVTEWSCHMSPDGGLERTHLNQGFPDCIKSLPRGSSGDQDDYSETIEIDVAKIPKTVKKIRIKADVSL